MATINEKIEAIVLLRDRIKTIKDEQKKKISALENSMTVLEDSLRKDLLKHEEESGKARISAAAGTIFFTIRTKYNVEDRSALESIVEQGLLPMSVFSNTVSKEIISEYIKQKRTEIAEEKGIDESEVPLQLCLPAGVKVSEYQELSVRKSS